MPSLILAVHLVMLAQTGQAVVTGVVRDEATGQPIAGVLVTLRDQGRSALSDALGRYVLRDVSTGPQHLSAQRLAYATRVLHALVPAQGELVIDIMLQPEPVRLRPLRARPSVELPGSPPVEDVQTLDRVITISAIRNHPLLAEVDVLQALSGGEILIQPETPSGVHIRGGESDQTAFLLDGVPVLSPYHTGGLFSAWNPDAIARMRIAALPSGALPHALGGTVTAETLTPGARLRTQAGLSTTHARAAVDGPIGGFGAGYLLSLRAGFPGIIAPRDEASYVQGRSGDALLKVEAPLPVGYARFTAYDSRNRVHAAATVETPDTVELNTFTWHSRSVGVEWTGSARGISLRVQGWRAALVSGADWQPDSVGLLLRSRRRDFGLLARAERRSTTLGIRSEQIRTFYAVASAGAETSNGLIARLAVNELFLEHAHDFSQSLSARMHARVVLANGAVRPASAAQLRWSHGQHFTFSASYAHQRQFVQSLRNAESIAGGLFPVDLFVAAGSAGVPSARSDVGILTAELIPLEGVRIELHGYARGARGLVLVAPRSRDPFGGQSFSTGTSNSRGLSVQTTVSGARSGIVASYAWQSTRLDHGDTTYVPGHGTEHTLEAGAIYFPSPTASLRLGLTAALGRRSTAVTGVEWEACNLLDRGCEFGGSPRTVGAPGTTVLPAYLRADLGARKHWHVAFANRDAQVAVFGTVTNLFARKNTLTTVLDPVTGELSKVEMRPLAPLVLGLDWRF